MDYVILHNRQSAASRDFVANLPEGGGHTVIEWYTEPGAVAKFLEDYPGLYPSDFPSVVIRIPDVQVPEKVGLDSEAILAHLAPAHWELMRCPVSLAEVEAAVDKALEG